MKRAQQMHSPRSQVLPPPREQGGADPDDVNAGERHHVGIGGARSPSAMGSWHTSGARQK
jgi:hypothetical protein